MIQINTECLCLDNSSVKVHFDGSGARKKQVQRPLENQEKVGTRRANSLVVITRGRP